MPVYPSGGTIAQSVGSPGFGPAPTPSYNASASVRFNPADTAYFSYVPTLQGSRTTWTWSGWVKRSVLGNTYQELFGTPNGATDATFLSLTFGSNGIADTLGFQIWNSTYRTTTQVFRDTAQWYHILLALDTTQSTAADRVKLYVNGTQVTAFSTTNNPAQFAQLSVNVAGSVHAIGRDLQQSINFGGYLADINFVDGLALTPSSFTSTDTNTGQLVPIQYTGNRGTNGFYLPFSGAALAADLGQNPKTTAQDYPYWPYSTLLVNTTSTNGAQNNTFLDSSTNNFTITRNGNTTQGNFTPFTFGGGTTQANGYYSGYFDGNGDSISVPDNAAFELFSNNFTIECWVFPLSTANAFLFSQWENSASSDANSSFVLSITSSKFQGAVAYGGTASQVTLAGTTTVSVNQWYHIALVRSGSSLTLYVNGRQENTSTTLGASTVNNSNLPIYIGTRRDGTLPFQGYISNARIVNTRSEYTTNFTVPTTPLTAVLYTVLLTCQSSQFIDNSTNAFAITAAGNSQPVTTNPFGMTAWSGYFDGTGDYLSIPTNTNTNLHQIGDWTYEGWIYWNSMPTTGYQNVFGQGVAGQNSFGLTVYNGTSWSAPYYFVVNQANIGNRIVGTTTLIANVWYHFALVRSSGVLTLYVNGRAEGTYSNSTSYAFGGSPFTIGNSSNGQISNFRFVRSAVYTANFTPPTAPLTAITNTQLLTCQNSTFIDNSPNNYTVTAVGNSYTGTLNNPFGNPMNYTTPPVQGWSTYFDGSGDYISTTPTALTYGIGTGLFTWESWIYTVNSSATAQGIWHYYTTVTDIIYPYIVSSTGTFNCQLRATNQAVTTISSPSGTIRVGQWHHVVVTRDSSTTISLYVDGKKVAGSAIAASTSFADTVMNTSNGNNPVIGAQTNTLREYFYGYISNLRFVKGAVVYTGNFTPPTAPLTAIPGTMTLACQSNRVLDNSILNAAQVANGNTSISPSSPFIPTQAWSSASYGGTMYFDGTGDYLSIADNATLEFGSSDFTIEAFIYPTATVGANRPIWSHGTNSTNWMSLYLHTTAGRPEFAIISGGSTIVDIWPADVISPNIWYHLAVTRSGSTFRMFLNGALIGTGTNASAVPDYTDDYRVGFGRWNGDTGVYAGYISNFRILKGTALYTTPFVPPVLPPTAIANTSLLLSATNSGITDATGQNVLETVGNAQVSTAVKKWGTSSVYLDGSGDYLVIPTTNAPCQFGTADFTIEAWIYSTTIANQQMILSNRIAATGSANFDLQIVTSKLRFGTTSTDLLIGTITLSSNTWYHVAVSRVSGTARMFVNGVLDTSTTTSFNLSNNSITHIGTNATYAPTQYPFIGYIQDLRITKGVGRYSGAFTPPAAAFAYNQYDIGNQQWAPTNISVTAGMGQDNLVDSPSDYGTDTGLGGQVRGNYATLNPLQNGGVTLTNGNLDGTSAPANWITTYATIGISTGKWYWEGTCTRSSANEALMGIVKAGATLSSYVGFDANGWCYYTSASSSLKINNASTSAYGAIYTTGDVIGVALDLDAGTLVFYKNGVSQGTAYSSLSGQFFPAISVISNSAWVMNFGQRAFAYTAPTGFKCLVSTNLPTVNGIGATSSTQANDYFDVALYTGTNATQNITTLGLQPDLVWIKGRSFASNHVLTDAVRGVSKQVFSSLTNAETTEAGKGVTAFNSNGFTLGPDLTVTGSTNASTQTYVAWNWKANGAGVANTAGTIPSTVSANTTSAFSIVTFTTNSSSGNATVGHGLGVTPSMIIMKSRNAAYNWDIYHSSIANCQNGRLIFTSAAYSTANQPWGGVAPTSSVFTMSQSFYGSGIDTVAYCFAPVEGYSAFGSYTGNGSSTQGPMIYTGFRPAFVMIKSSSIAADWVVYDDARNPSNLTNLLLIPNTSGAQVTGVGTVIDMVSNGFLPRNAGTEVNQASATYVYAAFAEFPFKYSRAR